MSAAQLEEQESCRPWSCVLSNCKWCAAELASVLTGIFNWYVNQCKAPACFKSATIIPEPNKPKVSCLNDYRPVALTVAVMKAFERTVCKHRSSAVLDPNLFAYRVKTCGWSLLCRLHSILQNVETPATCAWLLFINCRTAFHTMISTRL